MIAADKRRLGVDDVVVEVLLSQIVLNFVLLSRVDARVDEDLGDGADEKLSAGIGRETDGELVCAAVVDAAWFRASGQLTVDLESLGSTVHGGGQHGLFVVNQVSQRRWLETVHRIRGEPLDATGERITDAEPETRHVDIVGDDEA